MLSGHGLQKTQLPDDIHIDAPFDDGQARSVSQLMRCCLILDATQPPRIVTRVGRKT